MLFSYTKRPPRRKFLNEDPSMTIQAAADDCDINVMIARYQKTGSYHGQVSMPSVSAQFGDFVSVPDYHAAMNLLVSANDQFAALPSAVRDRFQNDPARLLDFLSDEKNLEEAVKLGICSRVEVLQDSEPAKPAE